MFSDSDYYNNNIHFLGNIEGQHAKKHKKLYSLSEQQGLDCDQARMKCNTGGWPIRVYQ